MEIILGFVVMLILIAISSIPNILVLIFKKGYGKPLAVCLFLISTFIYISLKVACVEADILKNSNSVPFLAMFVFYFVAGLGVALNNSDKNSDKDNCAKILEHLEKYTKEINMSVFDALILPKIKDFLSKHKDDFNTKEIFKDENFLEHYVLGMISNLAGDMVETGQHHLYHGVLSQDGKDLLKIYDFAMTRLVQLGANNPDGKPMTMNYVAEQRQIINKNIASVG